MEDADRIPQGQLFLLMPKLADWIFHSNPYALARILFGKPLYDWKGLKLNGRVGLKPIDDAVFKDVILNQITSSCYRVWWWGYHFGNYVSCARVHFVSMF